uniref:Cysteine protease n=2 Tax=Mesocestoides corti TaxID=53468 RepID=A0A5K3FVR2_MESCO
SGSVFESFLIFAFFSFSVAKDSGEFYNYDSSFENLMHSGSAFEQIRRIFHVIFDLFTNLARLLLFVAMDVYWDSLAMFTTPQIDYSYLPDTDEQVWILGTSRSSLKDRVEISDDIRSRLWFTYRKGFVPIGDTNGPTTDTGWGCMHRCAQMLVGQALIQLHLGREWRWNPDRPDVKYRRILEMFQDKPNAPYSIHRITTEAITGDKKPVNSWLGPNTAAQTLKKLSVFDRWSNLAIHVTTEDGIVVPEIKMLCRQSSTSSRCNLQSQPADEVPRKSPEKSPPSSSPISHEFLHYYTALKNSERPVIVSNPISRELDDDSVEIILPPVYSVPDNLCANPLDPKPDGGSPPPPSEVPTSPNPPVPVWRPLLLIVPLRLGLHEFNMCYAAALKGLFKLPQCVGIMGGRPNHALWLIGSVGDHVLCLDPHTTQPSVGGGGEDVASLDASFHSSTAVRLPFARLDPSLAVGFVCATEAEFDALRTDLLADVLSNRLSPPIFEIHEVRPHNMPPPSFASLRTPDEWSYLW